MPLDPSIFMQGAQLKAQNDARTQSIIGGFFDKLAANKQKQIDLEKAKATDYEGSAMRVLQAKAQGVAPDPADLVRAKAYGEFQSMQNAYDPNTASVYPKNRNIFETMGTAPSTDDYVSPYAPPQGINPSAMPPYVVNKPVNNDIGELVMTPVGDNYAQVSQVTPPQRDMARGVVAPMGATPKTKQAAQEANVGLQEESGKVDLSVLKAGGEQAAKMTQENRINSEQKKKGLQDISVMVKQLLKDAEGAPTSSIGGMVATATEKAGYPNEQAIARANFESGKAITGLNSRIAFLKGQGTITDAEAQQAMAFLPDPNAPFEIKKAKLEGALNYIEGLIGENKTDDPLTIELRRRGLVQ